MWTYSRIKYTTAGWRVPPIVKGHDIRYFEDSFTAFQFAQERCRQYNELNEGYVKIPLVDSKLHTKDGATSVYIGAKAALRAGLNRGSGTYSFPVINVFAFSNHPNTYFAFGQVVANGEIISVISKTPFQTESVIPDVQWTNVNVTEYKRACGYPVNTFIPKEKRDYDFLPPKPPPVPEPPPTPLNICSMTKDIWSGVKVGLSDISEQLSREAQSVSLPSELFEVSEINRQVPVESVYHPSPGYLSLDRQGNIEFIGDSYRRSLMNVTFVPDYTSHGTVTGTTRGISPEDNGDGGDQGANDSVDTNTES